jgi:hypothetical protein
MTDENTSAPNVVPAVPPEPVIQEIERLSDVDRLSLELAKSTRLTAVAEAKAALANSEKAELSYKYVILQLYMKYGLTAADAIKESGEILRGGALPQG